MCSMQVEKQSKWTWKMEDVHVPLGQTLPWGQGPELDQMWSLFPKSSLGHDSGIRVTCSRISAVTGDE